LCASGSYYYKYNDSQDVIVEGYPRLIATDFGSKSGSNETIPDNIDAVLFDDRDNMLYFFKGEYVRPEKHSLAIREHIFSI